MESFAFEKELRLPRRLRKYLGNVHGKVIVEKDLPALLKREKRVYAVGDVVVGKALRSGHVPFVSVFDYRIGRHAAVDPLIRRTFRNPLRARNRRSVISRELWDAIKVANISKIPIAIRVSGEEDLAAVACAYLAPIGSLLIYGLPGKGIDSVRITLSIRKTAMRILRAMNTDSG